MSETLPIYEGTDEDALPVLLANHPNQTHWRQSSVTWGEFASWFADVKAFAGDDKEAGNYVLGSFVKTTRTCRIEGKDQDCTRYHRVRTALRYRSVLTLDVDTPASGFAQKVEEQGWLGILHTTHSSRPKKPRYRLIVRTNRAVTVSEYFILCGWIMQQLGTGNFDRGSDQPERFMYRPSTPQADWWECVPLDGKLLDVDATLDLADLIGGITAPPEHVTEEEEERAFDTSPSAREIALARQWVKRAKRWIPDLKTPKGDKDHRAPGRNRVAYDWLLFLYCFAKGGCLTEHEIETAVWDAIAEVPADHPFTETEWQAAKDSAYTNAVADRPHDDNGLTPLSAGTDADDDGLPPMRPGLFYERGDKDARGFLPVSFVNALTKHLEHYAVGTDGEIYVWKKGVWVPGEGDIGTLVVEALGDEYERAQVATVLDVMAKRRGVPVIDRGPTPEWINVRNGLLHWRTGKLHPHTPDVPSTVQLSVEWDPTAECPQFDAFLADVLPADCLEPMDGGPGFVWELIAYMLLSGNPHQIAVLFRGLGRNGKGVFLRVIEVLLGARNIASVSLHELDDNRFAAAELYGKAANIVGDLDTKALRGTDVFKRITGGDLIRAEKKFKDAFSFYCWAVPIFSSNRVFTTSDSADGYFERWVIVNFPNSFYGKEDRGLAARLTSEAELQGVLRKAMEALPALMRRGRLPQPGSVAETKERFVLDSDRVRGWLAANCEFGPDHWTKTTDLWHAYHLATGGEKDSLGRTEFYLRLDQIGDVQRSKRRGAEGFKGIRLRERSPGDDFHDE